MFRQGELIYAVVLDMEPDKNRFSLSTADLESTHGEIIYDKETVMKNAPKMVGTFCFSIFDNKIEGETFTKGIGRSRNDANDGFRR